MKKQKNPLRSVFLEEGRTAGTMPRITCNLKDGRSATERYTVDAFEVANLLTHHVSKYGVECRACYHGFASSRTGCRSPEVVRAVKRILTIREDDTLERRNWRFRVETDLRDAGYPINKINPDALQGTPPALQLVKKPSKSKPPTAVSP